MDRWTDGQLEDGGGRVPPGCGAFMARYLQGNVKVNTSFQRERDGRERDGRWETIPISAAND